MNELFLKIASDLNINSYTGESEESFISRVSYSAIGAWCLALSLGETNKIQGISKHSHTTTLDSILAQYQMIAPALSQYVVNPKRSEQLSVKIRKLYEDVGYIITENNKNIVSPYGIHISTNSYKDIYLGFPGIGAFEMNGLGCFVEQYDGDISVSTFLARECIDSKEYIKSQYNVSDFEERDIDASELSFFNPLLKSAPSQSWQKEMVTTFSIARKTMMGPYYRVLRAEDGTLLYVDEQYDDKGKGLYAEDFRRLYFSLRSYYENPQPVWVTKIDDSYVRLQFSAKLPAREYFLLLLASWPEANAFSTQRYIMRKELLPVITHALKSIDIIVKEF